MWFCGTARMHTHHFYTSAPPPPGLVPMLKKHPLNKQIGVGLVGMSRFFKAN